MENRHDVTVPMPASLVDDVESELEYGNSRAEWIREAIRMRLEAERSAE
jgi:metal-responsive CopG/Arc/MetJ family transcriptional regulator